MKKLIAVATCSLPMIFASTLYAQTQSGSTAGGTAGATTTQSAPAPATTPPAAGTAPESGTMSKAAPSDQKETISGWSVKDKIMGKAVYNDQDQKIGDISDVVLSGEGKAVYFVVGAGGFLGMGAHDVAIPYDKITQNGDKMVLPGYTKDQLKALPKVEVKK